MMLSNFLQLGSRITLLPIIHGSGDFAIEVRRVMLSQKFDCLAVPLPPSFQEDVERAIAFLPSLSAVVQQEPRSFIVEDWQGDEIENDDDGDDITCSYVPIDPCQGVIAALRIALQERIPRAFIDLETACFESVAAGFPDPYALKKVPADKFAAAILPAVAPLPEGQPQERVVAMANQLRLLEKKHSSILFICSMTDWVWIREAYLEQKEQLIEDETVEETQLLAVDPERSLFMLGELPFITSLYERARFELDDDENLSIDGIKEMVLAARDEYQAEFKLRARKISTKLLSIYFKYVRNLSLIESRMTPDFGTLVTAAQQLAGDQFAIHLAEVAREYQYTELIPFPFIQFGINQARLPDGDVASMISRLPGHPVVWRHSQLTPTPPKIDIEKWQSRWNPHQQCSWPPEDVAIENFRTHIKDAALALLGADLARTEKFSASLKDGLDIRETLRNWHTGELYVKVLPPSRGSIDCVVMLFDSPADPRDYPWRITWHAEHDDESTLALFATDFHNELVGPGIAMATYGGGLFLFPPRPIYDIWQDPRFNYTDTLEERILAAACTHSQERHIALLSHSPPGAGWRRLAKRHGKKLLHIPLGRFSQQMVQQLRMFHVLNGQQIRSFAAHFIRKA